jgi:hypothetical protein
MPKTGGFDMSDLLTILSNIIGNNGTLWFIVLVIVLIFIGIKQLPELIPGLQILQAKILIPLSKHYKFKLLERAAIRSDIQGKVNSVVQDVQKELPIGWVRPMTIQWATAEDKDDFLREDQAVIVMKPLEMQDHNLVTAIYYYFKKSCFPKIKTVIPEVVRESAVLQLSKRVIDSQAPDCIGAFEDELLEPKIADKAGILGYLNRYDSIDEKGFFSGAFLREAQEIGRAARFTKARSDVGTELSDTLKHIEDFITKIGHKEKNQPWVRRGKTSSYAFLLVARPEMAMKESVQAYVDRARTRAQSGVQRMYVFGTSQEDKFVRRAISAIDEFVEEYELVEVFSLHRDYRGEKGGTGALFAAKTIEK